MPSGNWFCRFGNWLEENKDWALSRERFWGSPLPLWVAEDFAIGDDASSGKVFAVGSVAELREGFIDIDSERWVLGEALDRGLVELDLHKPFVDRIYFIRDGVRFRRTPELIDVWFDSGSMPFAQLHYPFENKELFHRTFPADFIAEGVDQTRGWFYTFMRWLRCCLTRSLTEILLSTDIFSTKTARRCRSQRAMLLIPLRPWIAMVQTPSAGTSWLQALPGARSRSILMRLKRSSGSFSGPISTATTFFVLYANVDGFTGLEPAVELGERSGLDRWVLSSLNTLVGSVHMSMERYDLTGAARLINDFIVDDLSNWYIRRSRKRFWKSDMGADKLAAYQSLFSCLETLAKLLAPFTPFLAERLYLNLNARRREGSRESVHLADFPLADAEAVDRPLEERMKKAQIITSLVRTMRERASIKVRQPLQRILLSVDNGEEREQYRLVADIIMEEVNVRKIEYIEDEGSVISKKVKPNFKTLGPRFGKDMKALGERVRSMSHKQIALLEKEGVISLECDGKQFEIQRGDVEILHEDIEGWLVASDEAHGIMVALDTEMTEELAMLGLSRELVSRIQTLRKESGLEITDRIVLSVEGSDKLLDAVKKNDVYIKDETLATELRLSAIAPEAVAPEKGEMVNGEPCRLRLEKS